MVEQFQDTCFQLERVTSGLLGFPEWFFIWRGNKMIASTNDGINWKIKFRFVE